MKKTRKMIVNKIRCNKCGAVIESVYTHDMKYCRCGSVYVDGGKDYPRRGGNINDYTDLSRYEYKT